jgi:hypothetical protein
VRRLSGVLLIRDDRVWLERGCPDHGLVRTLYDESPEILRYLEQWQAPTKQHIPDQADNYRPVPEAYAYGLPAMQTQHTCILLQDIIEHCNLRCPSSGAHMLKATISLGCPLPAWPHPRRLPDYSAGEGPVTVRLTGQVLWEFDGRANEPKSGHEVPRHSARIRDRLEDTSLVVSLWKEIVLFRWSADTSCLSYPR